MALIVGWLWWRRFTTYIICESRFIPCSSTMTVIVKQFQNTKDNQVIEGVLNIVLDLLTAPGTTLFLAFLKTIVVHFVYRDDCVNSRVKEPVNLYLLLIKHVVYVVQGAVCEQDIS